MEDLVTFFLTAGEAFVQITVAHFERDAHFLVGVLERRVELEQGHRLFAMGIHSSFEEVRGVDSRDLARILHRKEDAGFAALVDGQAQKVDIIEINMTFSDREIWVAHNRGEKRGFTMAIWAQ